MIKIKIFEFNPFGENTYVVSDSETSETAIIDPGMMQHRESETFDRYITDNSLTIKYLINTHLHVDHVAGDIHVQEKYQRGLSASPLDGFLATRIAEQARMFRLSMEMPTAIDISLPLSDGDRLFLGKEPIDILSVPGHSPGSIALYFPNQDTVIVGDVLFNMSIGRTDLPGGDLNQLLTSIKEKLLVLPDNTTVLPGHGPSTTIGKERHRNPYLFNL